MPYRILGFIFVVLAAACVCRASGTRGRVGRNSCIGRRSVLLRIGADNRWLTQPKYARLPRQPPSSDLIVEDRILSDGVKVCAKKPSDAVQGIHFEWCTVHCYLRRLERRGGQHPNAVVVYLETGIVSHGPVEDIFSKERDRTLGFVASDVPARKMARGPGGNSQCIWSERRRHATK